MSNAATVNVTIDDVMDAIKELRRELADFRAVYDHHSAQESRIHSAMRDEVRETNVKVSGIDGTIKGAISAISHDLSEVDARVGILESAVH